MTLRRALPAASIPSSIRGAELSEEDCRPFSGDEGPQDGPQWEAFWMGAPAQGA